MNGSKSGTTSIRKLKLNGIPCKINGVKSGVTLLVQIQILNKLQKQKSMNQYQHQNQQDLSLQSKNAVVKQLVENPSVTTSASFTSTTQSMESRNAKIHITLHGLTTTHAQQVTDGSWLTKLRMKSIPTRGCKNFSGPGRSHLLWMDGQKMVPPIQGRLSEIVEQEPLEEFAWALARASWITLSRFKHWQEQDPAATEDIEADHTITMVNVNLVITNIPILFLKRRMRKRRTRRKIGDGTTWKRTGGNEWEIISTAILQRKSKSNGKAFVLWSRPSASCSVLVSTSCYKLLGLFSPKKLKHLRHSLKVFSWALKLQMDQLSMLLQLFRKMPT